MKLETEDFNSLKDQVELIDVQYGKYSTTLKAVFKGSGNHPLRTKENRKQTCLEKFGVEHPMQASVVLKKALATNIERYGVERPLQSQSFLEKTKTTNLERYGAENPAQGSLAKEKVKKANLARYGVEHSFQAEEVKAKIKATNIERYGVDVSLKSKEIADKSKTTNLERYGVENASQAECIKSKRRTTMLDRYGVEQPFKLDMFKDKFKQTLQDRYGVDNPSKIDEVKAKVKQTNLDRYGITNTFQLSEVKFASKGELELKEYIESLGLKTQKWYIGGNPSYELDIYISELNLAFEYNGDYWHSEAQKPRDYHYLKSKRAKEKGIQIIHIFETEWLQKQEVVKDFISLRLGKTERRYFARKLTIKEVSKEDSKDFFNAFHLQGAPFRTLYCYGLYIGDELLMATAFSKPHRQRMTPEPHLSRLASKKGVQVVGGISKLCSYVFKLHGPFISYVHDRLSSGDSYRNAGFTEIGKVKPTYWYYDKNKKIVISKQSRQKKLVNTHTDMTEHEHALRDGLVRVYDCGKTKFLFTLD